MSLTPSFNLPAPGRCHTLYFPSTGLQSAVFLLNSPSHHFSEAAAGSVCAYLTRRSVPSPEVTVQFCLVPSPGFSQAPWYTLPDHLCRSGVRPVPPGA